MKRNSITRFFSSVHQSLHVFLLIVPVALWFAWCAWCLANWLTNGARMSLPKSIWQMKRPALVLLFAMIGFAAPAQTIRYVKQGGSGAGTSWTDASGNLQAMINASASGDPVWVAAGVYKPTTGTDRAISFSLKNGVAVYGGFPDTGDPDMNDRDWETYITTLSGDIGAANDNSDNSFDVIYNLNVNNTALLNGFTISGGNANGSTNVEQNGGGMYNQTSSPGIIHCMFIGNSAEFRGGGMYNAQSSHPAVTDCTFSNNSAGTAGGGVANTFSSAPVFTDCSFSDNSAGNPGYSEGGGGGDNSGGSNAMFNNCTFTGNSSTAGGGGMRNSSSNPTFNDCTFSQNNCANNAGAGMLNYYASPVLTNCIFSQNNASSGAGMFNYFASPELNDCSFMSNTSTSSGGGMENSFSAPTLNDCIFTGNTTLGYGGGILNSNVTSGTFNRCVFTSNTAFGGGGASFSYQTGTVLNQCLFAGNSAGNSGGGVLFDNDASPSLSNCNFIGNTAEFGGAVMSSHNSTGSLTNCSMSGNSANNGGAMFTFSTQVALTNCILWGNNSGIGANPGIFANVSQSIVQQSSGIYPGTGNLNLDPLFVDQPPVGLGTAGNLQLQECSPAIDGGTNTGAPDEDFDGNPRPFNAVGLSEAMTDIGAWEYQSAFEPDATPSVSISGPTQVGCSVPAVYTATPVDGGASPVYQWRINGNKVGTNSPTFSTTNLQVGDVVSCDLTSSIPCAYPVIATSNTIGILILDPPPGDPSVFGDNEWRVYAWNAGGAAPNPDSWNTNYSGFYTATGLNFNTQNQWNADFSPSTASGYQGCFVGNDNHSFSAKRKGFTCAYYRISIDGHDDAAQLWIDGAMMWEHIGCCDNHLNAWEGFLDADSEVEFRVTEGSGGSNGAISFQLVTPAITGLNDLCSGTSATLSVSGGLQGNYTWSTYEMTPTIEITTGGNYAVTIGDGGGCSVEASGIASSPAGDPAVFGSNVWNVYAWNAGGATPDVNTWNTGYAGYYTVSSVNLNTQSQWNNAASPSGASNYAGCAVGNNNHSFSAKRMGFTCGNYAVSIDAHKDHAELWVDGVKVWEHSGCCDNHPNVWYGLLDGQTEMEFRVTHGTGVSYGAISIQPVTPTLTGLNDLCGNTSAMLGVSNNPAGNYLWSTGETTPTIQVTAGGAYTATLSTSNGCSATVSGQAAGPVGNPAVFGDGAWRVYAWNGGGAEPTPGSWNTAYSGFYIINSLNLNTQQQWNANSSPSSSPGYQGCSVGIDNHSFSAKRKGFSCNFYRINIDSHDDAAQLWIDGEMVWEHIGCCDVHTIAWQGFLGADSEVEFRVTEGSGGSHGSISFHAGALTLTGTPVICPGSSDGTVSAPEFSGASYIWSTGAGTASISNLSPGVYSVTVGNSAGCTDGFASFTIEESQTITGAATICQGSSATLQANIAGPVIWNSGSYTFVKTSSGQADAIVASTHITRGNNGFIYNAVTQSGPNASGVCNASVQNVQWALGSIEDWASLTFTNTMPVPGCAGYNIPGLQLVMRLVAENIYLQVTFSYWQDGGGGRFTYTRTTGPSFLWSTGETTSSISVSAAGIYTVTVNTGENGCTSVASHTVDECNDDLRFSGTIKWAHDGTSGVQNATVNLTGAVSGNDLSDTDGYYEISIPPTSGNFTLKPVKNTNKLNGLSSADVTAIQQHVTNLNPLPAPFKRIAADVNKSNSITTLDATLISQVLQGNPQANAFFNTAWRFVPTAYTFPNPNVPWGFPEQIVLTGVSGDVSGQDFKGIKLGDVASTWANPANFGAGEPLVFRVQDRVLQAGAEVTAEFRADQLDDLNSFQFALYFDPEQLQLISIEPLAGLPVSIENFGTFNLAEGEIRMVWAQEKSVMLSEAAPVFRLRFKALESGARLSEVLQLNPEYSGLPGHVYNSKYAESGVELRYSASTGTEPAPGEPVLSLTNQPNPFTDVTTLRFVLPEAGEGELRITDAAGRLLFLQKKYYTAGQQIETLRLDGASGVLFAELVTEKGSVARKMLAVKKG